MFRYWLWNRLQNDFRGTLTTLYDFCSKSGCADGAVLYDALKQGPDGNYYGTTWAGGAGDGGTVFTDHAKKER